MSARTRTIAYWVTTGLIVAPALPRLKEWAYAGIFFNMTGAAVSHVVSGSAAWHVGVTLALAAITLASWALRPANRMLGSDQSFVARVNRRADAFDIALT